MAKELKVNKSQETRDAIKRMGMAASPSLISERLRARGIDVSPHMVSVTKTRMKKSPSMNGASSQGAAKSNTPRSATGSTINGSTQNAGAGHKTESTSGSRQSSGQHGTSGDLTTAEVAKFVSTVRTLKDLAHQVGGKDALREMVDVL